MTIFRNPAQLTLYHDPKAHNKKRREEERVTTLFCETGRISCVLKIEYWQPLKHFKVCFVCPLSPLAIEKELPINISHLLTTGVTRSSSLLFYYVLLHDSCMIVASSIWFTSKNTSVCLGKVVHACTEPEKLILRLILRLSCHWIILLKIGESVEESLVHLNKKSNNSYWSHSNMCIQHKCMYSLVLPRGSPPKAAMTRMVVSEM